MLHILAVIHSEDWIDPTFGIVVAVILWTILLIVAWVGWKRAKVRARKKARLEAQRKRRETYIATQEAREDSYIQSLEHQ